MRFAIKASLRCHSCEFEVDAESIGQALNRADLEFRKIYCEALGLDPAVGITGFCERKIHAKEIKN